MANLVAKKIAAGATLHQVAGDAGNLLNLYFSNGQLAFSIDQYGRTISHGANAGVLATSSSGTPNLNVFNELTGVGWSLQLGATVPHALEFNSPGNFDGPYVAFYGDFHVRADHYVAGKLAVAGALADGVHPCGTGSITITNGVISAVS